MRKHGKYYGPKTPPRQKADDALVGTQQRVTIEKNVSGGAGLCRVDGHVIFVPESLSGEELIVEFGPSKGGYREAKIVEIIQRSPLRVTPSCKVYDECGGCDFQYASPEGQLELKKGVLEDTLRRQGNCSLQTEGISLELVAGAPWAYRNRMQFHPLSTDGLSDSGVGLMARKSNRVVNISTCPVASTEIQLWLESGASLKSFDTKSLLPKEGEQAIAETELGVSDSRTRIPVFGANGHLGGPSTELSITLLGKQLSFSSDGFFQSNLSMLEKMLLWLEQHLKTLVASAQDLKALDLYCGAGVFAAMLPTVYNQIWAVDNNPINCAYARKNTDPQRTTIFEGDVDWWLETDVPDSLDLVVVDPPRDGLTAKVREWLVSTRPRNIVYISCNPVTFSRDLKQIRAGGYRIAQLALFDFYPQTWHIETACIFVLDES